MIIGCDDITVEKIRAEVLMGDAVIARTPFVKNFSVNKSRNQLSDTFNVTLQLLAGSAFALGGRISIRAGLKGNLKTIFTGIIKTTQSQPAFALPGYFMLTMSGAGVLSKLENKKFTRRLESDGQGLFCLITGGPRARPSANKTLDKPVQAGGGRQAISQSPNPAAEGEHSPFVLNPTKGSSHGSSTGGRPADMADKTTAGGSAGSGTGEDFRVHDHSTTDEGGPAFGVYSSD